MPTKTKKPSTSIRRAAAKFRLQPNRDDHNPGFDTVRVFVPSPLMHGGDIGISGSPVVVLMGYGVTPTGENRLTSVEARTGSKVVGRVVELHLEELARLDQVAEGAGDWHRFLAEAVGAQLGTRFSCWVYQARGHATEVEMKTSAEALGFPVRKQSLQPGQHRELSLPSPSA